MSRFWVFVESLADSSLVTLAPDESRHVSARRLRIGDEVVAFDGRGRTADAIVEGIGRRGVEIRLGVSTLETSAADRFVLATAIPKGERLATMLPMLVQLGVSTWQPLVLNDSAVRDLDVSSARIQRILIESAKVARRPWLLEVRPPCGLEAVIAGRPVAGRVCFGAREGSEVGLPRDAEVCLIGPEAGFSAAELARLAAVGARACALGSHNLRIETAAVAAAAARFVARGAGGTGSDG
jgi:16S rRNA (uracil1498-N3)-methyltransferase